MSLFLDVLLFPPTLIKLILFHKDQVISTKDINYSTPFEIRPIVKKIKRERNQL